MINKRILSLTVCVVMGSVAAAPSAWAEQHIIIPVVLVVSQTTGRAVCKRYPKVQTALYRIQGENRQSHGTLGSSSGGTKTASEVRAGVWLLNNSTQRVELCGPNPVRSQSSPLTEIRVPMVLKLVIKRGVATDVSIGRAHSAARSQSGRSEGPVIPAVDLLTGGPTTVRPEYIAEYQEIVRSGRR